MFCPNCGTQLPDEAAFCGSCGTRLNVQPAPQPAPQPQEDPAYPQPSYTPYPPVGGEIPYQEPEAPKKNNMPKLIGMIAAAVAVVILLVVVFGGGGSNSPEGVVEKFYDAVLSGDFADAEDCVHPNMWEDIGGDFEEVGELMDMFGDSVTVDVKGSENVTDDEKEDVQEILDDYDIDEKLGEIYEVEVSMTISFMGMEQTETQEMLVAEISGTCYIVDAG